MHRKIIIGVSLLLIIFMLYCSTNSDNNDKENDDDNNQDDDSMDNDTVDDDTIDDDAMDDDNDDDDTVDDDTCGDNPPQIVNAYFDPNPMELMGIDWYSYLYIEVCDPDNDLAPDGYVCVYDDSTQPMASYCEYWHDLETLPGESIYNADDCGEPVTIYIGCWFGSIYHPPFEEYCVEIDGTDNKDHNAEMFGPVCVTYEQ